VALLFDFQCSEGHTTESLRSSDTKFIVCPSCGKTAKKLYLLFVFILTLSMDHHGKPQGNGLNSANRGYNKSVRKTPNRTLTYNTPP